MQKGKLKKPKETCKKKKSGPSPELWITIVLVLLILLAIPLIMMIDFFAYWDHGNGPFILIFMREVFLTGVWGLIFLLAGLFVALGSTYMILTKKAFNPKGLIMPGALLTVIFLGLAYGFLGVYWDDYAKDALTYVSQGAEEKIIVLEEYEVDQDFGRFSGPTEYIYKTSQGEAFTTQTIFEVDLILGAEYKVHYLPKTNYLVGIERIN